MKRIVLILTVIFLTATIAIGVESKEFDYRPITQSDLDQVRKDWANRDVAAHNAKVIYEENREGFSLLIVQHEISSRAHFGAIFVPAVDDLSTAPVVILPDHLEQGNPTIGVKHHPSPEYSSLDKKPAKILDDNHVTLLCSAS